MTVDETVRFHANALAAMTIATQGIEQVSRAVEVFTARGGRDAILALKDGSNDAQIDAIVADLDALGPVATALQNLFAGSNRTTMMRLRTDV